AAEVARLGAHRGRRSMTRDLGVWTADDCPLVLIDYSPTPSAGARRPPIARHPTAGTGRRGSDHGARGGHRAVPRLGEPAGRPGAGRHLLVLQRGPEAHRRRGRRRSREGRCVSCGGTVMSGRLALVVNGADVEVDDRHAKTPLLWVLRDVLELRG